MNKGWSPQSEAELESQESFDLVEIKRQKSIVSDGSRNGILPIPTPFLFTLERKAPYASDPDFTFDYFAGVYQP